MKRITVGGSNLPVKYLCNNCGETHTYARSGRMADRTPHDYQIPLCEYPGKPNNPHISLRD